LPKKILISFIRFYQATLSPDHGIFKGISSTCRFRPTCSEFLLQAIEKFGILKGGLLGIKRVSKCHPFNPGGWDPVPGENDK